MGRHVKTNQGEKVKHTLTTEDCIVIAQALDMAAKKGAFGAREMLVVGSAWNKLTEIVRQAQPKTPETPDQPEEPYNTARKQD
jgi:hypothetical protein|tara:strand:- start:1350 stop:1598 length:249 start_codon:yes stop_codon:yes gene_type:complete